jgi:hypothetical protein
MFSPPGHAVLASAEPRMRGRENTLSLSNVTYYDTYRL